MKKSQVLAAIALAFALGLAPIASTFALTNIQTECIDASGEAKELILALGDQTTMDVINGAKVHISNLKAAYKPTTNVLDGTVPATTDTEYPAFLIASIAVTNKGKVNGTELTADSFIGKNFDEMIALADSATYNGLTQETLDNQITAAKNAMKVFVDNVRNYLNALGLGANLAANATAGETVAYVDGLTDLNKTIALYDEYTRIANNAAYSCSSTDDEVVNKTIAAFQAAIAAFKNTAAKPGDAGDAQKPTTPDTGANTASEESATASVSILSGVASVVTAAGVVIRKAFRK